MCRVSFLSLESRLLTLSVLACFDKLFCGSVLLDLGPEEVEADTKCCFGCVTTKRRMPYGELSGVDKSKCCVIL